MSRGFCGEWYHDVSVFGRWCVRIWHRRNAPSWRPFFSTRYCVACFGAGPVGVQIMRYLSRAEFEAVGAPTDQPALIDGEFRAAARAVAAGGTEP